MASLVKGACALAALPSSSAEVHELVEVHPLALFECCHEGVVAEQGPCRVPGPADVVELECRRRRPDITAKAIGVAE